MQEICVESYSEVARRGEGSLLTEDVTQQDIDAAGKFGQEDIPDVHDGGQVRWLA